MRQQEQIKARNVKVSKLKAKRKMHDELVNNLNELSQKSEK